MVDNTDNVVTDPKFQVQALRNDVYRLRCMVTALVDALGLTIVEDMLGPDGRTKILVIKREEKSS